MTILEKLTKLEKEASDFGFKWENSDQIMAQIQSECAEIKVHLNNDSSDANDPNRALLQEEIGDLLHAVFSLCVFNQFNPQETLEQSITKFQRRFEIVKSLAIQDGLTSLNGLGFKELMKYWDKAKNKAKD